MTTRTKVAVAAGAAGVGALALARPVLDAGVARVEDRLCGVYPDPGVPVGERAAALQATLRIADLHADSLLMGRDLSKRGNHAHADVPRLIEGRVALQVMAMAVKTPSGLNIESNRDDSDDVLKVVLAKRWPPATWRRLLPRVQYLVAKAEQLEAGSGGRFRIIRSRADLEAYLAAHAADDAMTAGLLSIEGAHALDDDPANLEVVADLGVRMISMAHFFDTVFGGSAHGIDKGGLTPLGRELLSGMEARGILLDVAHASPATVDDALTVATRPVVASHTGVRGIVDNRRNQTDAQLEGIAATGGLVGIGFWETASGGRDATAIARSIAYAVERIGPAHVSLGSDWDGAVSVPFDAAGTVKLTQALVDVGLDDAVIRAVMGENVLRVLGETLPEG